MCHQNNVRVPRPASSVVPLSFAKVTYFDGFHSETSESLNEPVWYKWILVIPEEALSGMFQCEGDHFVSVFSQRG